MVLKIKLPCMPTLILILNQMEQDLDLYDLILKKMKLLLNAGPEMKIDSCTTIYHPRPSDVAPPPATIPDLPAGLWTGTLPRRLWWLLVAVATLVIVGVIAWFVRRQLAKRSAELAPPPPPPPHVVAWDRLQRALGLIHEADRFCVEVSLIIRDYLEQRFDLHAPDRTTEEFLFELQSSQRLAEVHKQLLADFLGACDMVKFAKSSPDEIAILKISTLARQIVAETSPLEFDNYE